MLISIFSKSSLVDSKEIILLVSTFRFPTEVLVVIASLAIDFGVGGTNTTWKRNCDLLLDFPRTAVLVS